MVDSVKRHDALFSTRLSVTYMMPIISNKK